jgi:hypothetical protein
MHGLANFKLMDNINQLDQVNLMDNIKEFVVEPRTN